MNSHEIAVHTGRVLARGSERPGIETEWLLDWTKDNPTTLAGWFNPDMFPAMLFADWLKLEVPGEKQLAVAGVWNVIRHEIAKDTEKIATCGVLLATDGKLEPHWGRLVSMNRIELHPDLFNMPGLGDALETLATGGWILHRGYLRPHEELNAAVIRAHVEGVKLAPKAACNALAGDVVAGDLLYQLRYWQPKRRRNGTRWVESSRDRWMAQTGLTRHQYDRALSILRKCGLAESKQFERRGFTHLRVLTYVAQGPRVEPEATS